MSELMPNVDDKMLFLEVNDYILDLQKELGKGFTKLKIICFKLTYNKLFKKIYPLILQELSSGSQVEIEIDGIFSRYNLTTKGFYGISFGEKRVREKKAENDLQEILNNLEKLGARITYINNPSWFNKNIIPFSGRDHRKVVFIERQNEKIAYFGATNLDEGEKNDFMLKIFDEELYERLYRINTLDFLLNQKDDITLKVDENLSFLLDIGGNFKSNIQDTADIMTSKAKNIIRYVNQLPPEPHMLWKFVKARLRGVKVEVVIPDFEEKQVTGFPYIFAFIFGLLLSKIFNFEIHPCHKGFTHAKILVCDEEILLGSHNLSFVGVAAGTRELSAYIRNSLLWMQVNNFVDNLIGNQFHSPIYKLKPNLLKNEMERS